MNQRHEAQRVADILRIVAEIIEERPASLDNQLAAVQSMIRQRTERRQEYIGEWTGPAPAMNGEVQA